MSEAVLGARRWLLSDGGHNRTTIAGAIMSDLVDEIERLRLTDAEQSLIRRLGAACEGGHPREWTNRALTADDRATLRGLLERLGNVSQ